MTTRTSLLAEGHGVVSVSYRQFHIVVDLEPFLNLPPLAAWDINNLVVLGEGGFMIVRTGIHTGAVRVTVEAHAIEPSPDGSWEESTEVSVEAVPSTQGYGVVWPLEARRGEMTVATWESVPANLPVLNPGGPGPYRVRVSANHRAHNRDGVDEEPVEEYLIQVWPEEE